MKSQAALLGVKQPILSPESALWQHAAVRLFAQDVALAAEKTTRVRAGHDLGAVPARGNGTDQAEVACPLSPRTCLFGGVCHACPVRVQPKLKISQPDDEYEREADRVAETLMRTPPPEEEDKERCHSSGCAQTVQRQTANTGTLDEAPLIVHEVLRSPGQPLDTATRAFMEPRFGHDFSGVQVHTDARATESARAVNALAYTVGQDVVFSAGQYAPETGTGRQLLAHELTHVVHQQNATKLSESDHSQTYADRNPDQVSQCSLGHWIQRKIRVDGTDLDAAGRQRLINDLITNKLKDIVPKVVSANLIRETVSEMYAVSDVLDFANTDAVASDVRHRVLLSHYMRASQGSTRANKAFTYPNSRDNGTLGVGPKVNDAAKSPVNYWGPIQNAGGNYYFDLSPQGLANPYQALKTLFTEHTEPHKRTLIHCDYVVSVLELRTYAENVGVARFNTIMKDLSGQPGAQPMRLKYNGFTDLLLNPTLSTAYEGGGLWRTEVGPAPLKEVRVSSKNDLIVGDHVIFYNHASYDALRAGIGGVWRLENAIVIDRVGGTLRFQGHGYFSPVTEENLIKMRGGLIWNYNQHVKAANDIIRRVKHGNAAARATARAKLAHDFPNVREKPAGGWEIYGEGLCGKDIPPRDLKPLTEPEVPGLKDPCNSDQISVKRPVEQKP